MEINEIKNCWKEEDKRISSNIKVNKNATFQKLRSSFDKVRIWRLLYLVQMCISTPLLLVLFVFPRLKNDGSGLYYLALVSFITLILFSFTIQLYYYICLLKIDFSDSLVKAQKEILRLEMLDRKLVVSGAIILPITTLSVCKIFAIPLIQLKPEAIIMIALIVLVAIISTIIKMRILIPKEYDKIKSYLNEIKESEED